MNSLKDIMRRLGYRTSIISSMYLILVFTLLSNTTILGVNCNPAGVPVSVGFSSISPSEGETKETFITLTGDPSLPYDFSITAGSGTAAITFRNLGGSFPSLKIKGLTAGTVTLEARHGGALCGSITITITGCCITKVTETVPASSLTLVPKLLNEGDCAANQCGITKRPDGPDLNLVISVFQVGCSWQFSVSGSRDMRTGDCFAQNNIQQIDDKDDDDITKDNFCALVTKFHNGGSGTFGGDCFQIDGAFFGKASINEDHENNHVLNIQSRLAALVANFDFELAITCPGNDTKAEALAVREADILSAVNTAYIEAHFRNMIFNEFDAQQAEFPAATDLAKDICTRAVEEPTFDASDCNQCVLFGITE